MKLVCDYTYWRPHWDFKTSTENTLKSVSVGMKEDDLFDSTDEVPSQCTFEQPETFFFLVRRVRKTLITSHFTSCREKLFAAEQRFIRKQSLKFM